ncbi:hypothetical protein scyTo_0017725 [Scyliorhinus torazame]|uniref:Uncharacterized protein n=1 Tax=Scyliorhinus torazame TaxID=75743 RepID=A0A401PYY0_SCYTO|nr:hypothetical protein [Scyliorhinus torazame]
MVLGLELASRYVLKDLNGFGWLSLLSVPLTGLSSAVVNSCWFQGKLQLLVEHHLQKQEQPEQDYSESDPSCLDELSPMMTECCHSNGAPAFLADTDWGPLNCCEHISNQTGIKLLLNAEDHPGNSSIGVTGSEQVAPLNCNDDVPHLSSRSSHQRQTETDTDEQTLKPRRKDTPFQHQPPLMTGVKHLRTHNETPFLEEDEAANEREEDWSQKTNL